MCNKSGWSRLHNRILDDFSVTSNNVFSVLTQADSNGLAILEKLKRERVIPMSEVPADPNLMAIVKHLETKVTFYGFEIYNPKYGE